MISLRQLRFDLKKPLLLFLLFALTLKGQSQKEHLSGFSMLSFTYKTDKNWMLYLELQQRSIEDFSKPDYYEIKGGAGYNINKNNQAFVGLGKYATYANSKISREELRLWLQYTYSFSWDRLKIDQRLRAEKRFFHDFIKDDDFEDSRYRYRISATLPLNNSKIEPNTIYVNVFDEIFVGPKTDFFKRNRVFTGIGYVLSKTVSSNAGYLWQRELTPTERNIHFLYLGFNFTISGSNKEAEHRNVAD